MAHLDVVVDAARKLENIVPYLSSPFVPPPDFVGSSYLRVYDRQIPLDTDSFVS